MSKLDPLRSGRSCAAADQRPVSIRTEGWAMCFPVVALLVVKVRARAASRVARIANDLTALHFVARTDQDLAQVGGRAGDLVPVVDGDALSEALPVIVAILPSAARYSAVAS